MATSDLDLRISVLRELYFTSWSSIRHLEVQRSQFTAASVAAFAALVAAYSLGFDSLGETSRKNVLIAVYLSTFSIGAFGWLVLEKTFERIKFLTTGMNEACKQLDKCLVDLNLENLVKTAEQSHNANHKMLSRIGYGAIWSWAFRLATAVGLIGAASLWAS